MILLVDFSNTSDKVRLYEVLKGLKPVPYQIELKIDRGNRSNNQNRYYWGVVIEILSEHTGFTPEEIHEVLKAKFLRYTKMLPTSEEVNLSRSTKGLDTKEFEEYMEKVRMFAIQELDVEIPLPNEYLNVKP